MRPIKWEYSLAFVFGLCSLVLLLLLLLANNYGQKYRTELLQELDNVNSAGFDMQDIPSYHFSEQALGEYTDIIERPLFFSGRRPIEPEEVDDPEDIQSAPVDIDVSLIGIISTPEGSYALFKDPNALSIEDKFKRLKQGDETHGWRIKEIKYDRVIVVSGQGSKDIMLAKPRVKPKVKVRKRTKRAVSKRTKKTRKNPFNQKSKK